MIQFFTTGGTIDKVYFDALSEFQIGPTALNALLDQANVGCAWRVEELMRKDSLDLDDADRAQIAAAVAGCDAARIIITHGTDTMVDTARVLGDVGARTVVLVGAMQPASLKDSDAPFNIGFALAAVQTLPPGVHIAMNGQLFDPAHVAKDRTIKRFVAA